MGRAPPRHGARRAAGDGASRGRTADPLGGGREVVQEAAQVRNCGQRPGGRPGSVRGAGAEEGEPGLLLEDPHPRAAGGDPLDVDGHVGSVPVLRDGAPQRRQEDRLRQVPCGVASWEGRGSGAPAGEQRASSTRGPAIGGDEIHLAAQWLFALRRGV